MDQVAMIAAVVGALAGIGGLIGYLVRPLIAINGELRTEVATLRAQNDQQEHRIHTLEELVTSRAAVDELAGYVADWRDEARRRDQVVLTMLERIAAKLAA